MIMRLPSGFRRAQSLIVTPCGQILSPVAWCCSQLLSGLPGLYPKGQPLVKR